jgi:hypothetical protein
MGSSRSISSRRRPLVDGRRVAAQPRTEIAAAGQRPGLEACHEVVSLPHLDARAVVVRYGVERAVEVTSSQRHHRLELVPRSPDVLEPVGDADELHLDLVALDLVEVAHAPRWVYQPPLMLSWKTTVFSPLSSTSSK